MLCFLLPAFLGCSKEGEVQRLKPRMKLGAYYFAGWSGKCPYDIGVLKMRGLLLEYYTKEITLKGENP